MVIMIVSVNTLKTSHVCLSTSHGFDVHDVYVGVLSTMAQKTNQQSDLPTHIPDDCAVLPGIRKTSNE